MSKKKCEHKDAIIVRSRVSGFWNETVMANGDVYDTNTDDMKHVQPKTGICEECRKRVPNPNYRP